MLQIRLDTDAHLNYITDMTTTKIDFEQAIDYAMIHVNAEYPVSLASLEHWILTQVPGVTGDNYKGVTGRVLYALEDRKLAKATLEEDGFEVSPWGYATTNS